MGFGSFVKGALGGLAGIAGGALGGFVGGPLGGIVGSGIGSAFGDMISSDEQRSYNESLISSANQYNSLEAEKNRQFQKMMSDTAHQREIKDLKAAGLNPILSGMGGSGSSTPSGSSAQSAAPISNTAAETALRGKRGDQDIQRQQLALNERIGKMQMAATAADISLKNAQASTAVSQADLNSAHAAQARGSTVTPELTARALAAAAQAHGASALLSQAAAGREGATTELLKQAWFLNLIGPIGGPRAALGLAKSLSQRALRFLPSIKKSPIIKSAKLLPPQLAPASSAKALPGSWGTLPDGSPIW